MLKFIARLLRFRSSFGELSRLIQVQLISSYVTLIDSIRSLLLSGVAVIICLLIFFAGFILLHFSIFLILPWSIEDRAFFFAILSIIYMLVPAALIILLSNRSQWLKRFGVQKLIDRLPPQ